MKSKVNAVVLAFVGTLVEFDLKCEVTTKGMIFTDNKTGEQCGVTDTELESIVTEVARIMEVEE